VLERVFEGVKLSWDREAGSHRAESIECTFLEFPESLARKEKRGRKIEEGEEGRVMGKNSVRLKGF
jgi:hypothetical protein